MMAGAEITALTILVSRANDFVQEAVCGWYRATKAIELLESKLNVLKKESDNWRSLLKRYGTSADPSIGALLKKATTLLDTEEIKLQQLQASCCMRTGKKLLSPVEVIEAMDNVISAFENLSSAVMKESVIAEKLEKATLCKVARLPFIQDSKYVPFQTTITAVRRALESNTTGPIVTICGGPGQGKSSMARYLAFMYQDGIQVTESGDVFSKRFGDGVFFLSCRGKENIHGLLLQLWTDVGYQALPPSPDDSQDKAICSNQNHLPLLSEDALHKQLSLRLANQEVLIVLDDVMESTIVERLLVQGRGVKYLITTQTPRLWRDANCVEISIPSPTLEEANQILAKHVPGFPEDTGQDLQEVINEIIEESDFNPLVLANIATNIRSGRASELEEWKSTRKYLVELQDGDEKRPVGLYGRAFSKRTMRASTEMAFNSFSNEEQTLLFLASICEIQYIPEIVFRIFFKAIHLSLARFSRCSEHLEAINFIQIETARFPWTSIPEKYWSLHTMRPKFFLSIKEDEVRLMVDKLLRQSTEGDLIAALLVIYGKVSWSDQAAIKLGVSLNQLGIIEKYKPGRTRLDSIEPFVLMLHVDCEEEWQERSHRLVKQVILRYMRSFELDFICIANLLAIKDTKTWTCWALGATMQLEHEKTSAFAALGINMQISQDNPIFPYKLPPLVLDRLVGIISEEESPFAQENALWTLSCIRVKENKIHIGSHPSAVEGLVGLLAKEEWSLAQEYAARVLGLLCIDVVENQIKIGSHPDAIERLVRLLAKEKFPGLQGVAAAALGNICHEVIENKIKIGSSSLDRSLVLLRAL